MAEPKAIVRIASTDVDGSLPVFKALRRIKGVGFMFSNAVCQVNNIDLNEKIGALNQDKLKSIENTILNPEKLPKWLLNRRKDQDTGNDLHVTTAQLKLRKESDIKNLQKIKSNRGLRHQWGLPLRGQRTKGHFRHGKSVGVMKKVVKAQKAGKKE